MKLEVILQKLGLLQTGKIMYIGGSDVLPAPLKRPRCLLRSPMTSPMLPSGSRRAGAG